MAPVSSEMEQAVLALVTAIVAFVRKLPVPAEPEAWIDVASAAAYTSCAEDTVREMIASGVLPAGRLGVRGVRVRRSDIDRALRSQAAVPDQRAGTNEAAVARVLSSLRGTGGAEGE